MEDLLNELDEEIKAVNAEIERRKCQICKAFPSGYCDWHKECYSACMPDGGYCGCAYYRRYTDND